MNTHSDDIIKVLEDRYPQSMCALHYSKDYELMIAVRLSAQCTDARVNLVTPELFAAYPTLEAIAGANQPQQQIHNRQQQSPKKKRDRSLHKNHPLSSLCGQGVG